MQNFASEVHVSAESSVSSEFCCYSCTCVCGESESGQLVTLCFSGGFLNELQRVILLFVVLTSVNKYGDDDNDFFVKMRDFF